MCRTNRSPSSIPWCCCTGRSSRLCRCTQSSRFSNYKLVVEGPSYHDCETGGCVNGRYLWGSRRKNYVVKDRIEFARCVDGPTILIHRLFVYGSGRVRRFQESKRQATVFSTKPSSHRQFFPYSMRSTGCYSIRHRCLAQFNGILYGYCDS